MTDAQSHRIRTGDLVRIPNGEVITVAFADHDTGLLGWSGWPHREIEIAKVELERATSDDEHYAEVEEVIRVGGWLGGKAKRIHGEALNAWRARDRPKP